MQVQSLGWEDPLEEEMATNSSILAWKIPWTEEPGRLQYIGSQRVGHDQSDLAHIDNYLKHKWIECSNKCPSMCSNVKVHILQTRDMKCL